MKKLSQTIFVFVGLFFPFLVSAKTPKVLLCQDKINEKEHQAFREKVMSYAKEHQLFIGDWGCVNLDQDSKQERFALLCPIEGKREERGTYFIEKDNDHRWALSFEIDGRTQVGCVQEKASSQPLYQQKKEQVLSLMQGFHHGYENVDFAIRNQNVVIVKVETLEDITESKKAKVKNYDQLAKNGTPYPNFTDLYGDVKIEALSK